MAIKTVKCPACEAEQAIIRENETDTTMACAFCGEEITLPEYEAGESMDYSYDEEPAKDAKTALEPQGEGVEATFVLKEAEVEQALTVSGQLKERRVILYVETVLLALFGIAILVMNILGLMGKAGIEKPSMIQWLYVALCAIMIVVVWTMPKRTKKKIVKKATSGNQLTLTVYENLIHVHLEGHDPADDWQQPLDGSFSILESENLFILTLSNSQLMVLPKRALTEVTEPVVAQRLIDGSKKEEAPQEESPADQTAE